MITYDIQQEMLQYFMQLNEAEKKSVLEMIKTFLQGRGEILESISHEQYNIEIEEAMKRMDSGEFYSQQEVEQMSKTWINDQ